MRPLVISYVPLTGLANRTDKPNETNQLSFFTPQDIKNCFTLCISSFLDSSFSPLVSQLERVMWKSSSFISLIDPPCASFSGYRSTIKPSFVNHNGKKTSFLRQRNAINNLVFSIPQISKNSVRVKVEMALNTASMFATSWKACWAG